MIGPHLAALLFLLSMLCSASSKCPPDDPSDAVDYVVIPEDQYDRNYTSISSTDKHPLGFSKATWLYNQANSNPCIRVSGASNRYIEIMFETHPRSRLCVKDQNSEAECSDAGTGSYYTCRPAGGDVVYFEFYCDQGEEYDVRFWYRFVLGVLPAEDPEEHWCDGRQREDYPASLLQLPDDFPLNQRTTPSPDGALGLRSCSLYVSVVAGLVLMFDYRVPRIC